HRDWVRSLREGLFCAVRIHPGIPFSSRRGVARVQIGTTHQRGVLNMPESSQVGGWTCHNQPQISMPANRIAPYILPTIPAYVLGAGVDITQTELPVSFRGGGQWYLQRHRFTYRNGDVSKSAFIKYPASIDGGLLNIHISCGGGCPDELNLAFVVQSCQIHQR